MKGIPFIIISTLLILSCQSSPPEAESMPSVPSQEDLAVNVDALEVYPSEQRPAVETVQELDPDTSEGEDLDFPTPALTFDLLMDSAVKGLREGRHPVIHQGRPWGIIHDLDKNGYEDFLLLTLEGDGPLDTGDLMDSHRLFQDAVSYLQYGVSIFYQYPEGVINRYYVPLENKLVLQDFRFRELRAGRDFPYTLSVSFQTLEGTQEEWIILHGKGISRFTLEQTLSKVSRVRDIDGDGFLDVLVHQDGFEQGRGYETFITWYHWTGDEFQVYDRTNVLRNLQNFFKKLEEKIVSDGWGSCLYQCFEPSALESYITDDSDLLTVLDIFFRPLEGQEDSRSLNELNPAMIVFPTILENPFTYEPGRPLRFSFILKVQDKTGISIFYQGIIGMASNPFEEPQFYFLPLRS